MRFTRNSALAIKPEANGFDWAYTAAAQAEPELVGDTAVLRIRGPLSHHPDWFFESYDEILIRASKAFAGSAARVKIYGNTPGGEVSGCFTSARRLREMADAFGKPLTWVVEGETCSAGLALAMACDEIYVPVEGRFGSIGVIAELQNETVAANAHGVSVALVTSGARKSDGHPFADISEDVLASVQASVDYEAQIFFDWVSERSGVPADEIAGWQAQVFHGAEAVALGIADALTNDVGALAVPEENEGDQDMPGLLNRAANATGTGVRTLAVASMEKVRKMLGELSADDPAARKALDALDKAADEPAEKPEEKDEPAPHKEPDGGEGEDSDEGDDAESEDDAASAEGSDEGDDAESEDDASSAEDSDDARKAEDEEASAKACTARAAKSAAAAKDLAAKARVALRSGAKDAAAKGADFLQRADAATARAARATAEAKQHRSFAGIYRSNAAIAKRLATAPKAVVPAVRPKHPAVAAIAATGAQGKTAPKSRLASVPKAMREAAGIDTNAGFASRRQDGGLAINTSISPDAARKRLAELAAERLETEGQAS
jgi:ClpP class serine protease